MLPAFRRNDAIGDALHAAIFGTGNPNEPGRYEIYANLERYTSASGLTPEQFLGASFPNYQRFRDAVKAKQVEDSAEGLETLDAVIGEGFGNAVAVAGEAGRAFWAWFEHVHLNAPEVVIPDLAPLGSQADEQDLKAKVNELVAAVNALKDRR